MKESADTVLREKMSAFCREIFNELANNCAENYTELLTMWQELHDIYLAEMAASLQQLSEEYNEEGNVVEQLEANEAVVEFFDKTTGQLFRRTLPIHCLETANGIILSGESLNGEPAKIAFLSDAAMQKIHDLVGRGPDAPVCDHHNH
jgi:hypothetical protein